MLSEVGGQQRLPGGVGLLAARCARRLGARRRGAGALGRGGLLRERVRPSRREEGGCGSTMERSGMGCSS